MKVSFTSRKKYLIILGEKYLLCIGRENMDNLFNEDDLADLLTELESENSKVTIEIDPEMEASQRRYTEIIRKHREE